MASKEGIEEGVEKSKAMLNDVEEGQATRPRMACMASRKVAPWQATKHWPDPHGQGNMDTSTASSAP